MFGKDTREIESFSGGQRMRLTNLFAIMGALALLGPSNANANSIDFFAPNGNGADTTSIVTYSGIDFVEDAHFFYSGGIIALNGDISRNGFLLKGFVGTGDYEYPTSSVPGGNVDADATDLAALAGYQIYSGNYRFAAYVGVNWIDNDLNPKDPTNPTAGSETGFAVSGEFDTVQSRPLYLSLIGQYSTAYETYWSRVRPGYRFGTWVVGPEGIFMGDETYDAQRAGAFVSVPINIKRDVTFELTFSGGYQWIGEDEVDGGFFGGPAGTSDGGYGNVNISAAF